MPDWQKRVRTGARDKFFYWTAVFGSMSLRSLRLELDQMREYTLMSSTYFLRDMSTYVVLARISAES